MESKRLKVAKYLVRGESVKFAFHGVLLPSYLFLIILFCSGCSWFADHREPIQTSYNQELYNEMLSKIIRLRILQIEAEKYGVDAKTLDKGKQDSFIN